MPTTIDIREIDSADVYIGEVLAARMTRQDGDRVSFDYLADHSPMPARVRDQSVSWSLLRSADEPVITTGGAVPAFFAGLLPEGVRLGIVTNAMKTSADDHFTLLLAIGADTVGNIRVYPRGTDPVIPVPLFDPQRDNDFRAVFNRLTGSFDADPVGLSGIQPKVSPGMLSAPTQTPTGAAILKLNPDEYPHLVENEHFFMRMATDCGLRVATTRLLHDSHGRSALLVTRFDRAGATRIAQEDACQVANIYPASKYRIKTETALTALGDACARGGGSRVAAVAELFKTVVFSWLIGNGDLHGKNLSIFNPDGIWQPTPAYDLLCTQPYMRWRDPMALNLYGRSNRLTRAHFIESGERLGLRPRATGAMIDGVVDGARGWVDRCEEIGLAQKDTALLTALLNKRIGSLR